jgi:predicted DNA-binding protein
VNDALKSDQKHVQVSVRVPVELVEALERRAADADRTLSAELRRLIKRHVGETRSMATEGAV